MAVLAICALPPGRTSAQESVSFKRDIAPILLEKCQACHSPRKAENAYRVESYARVMAAGDSGMAGFVAGKVDESEAFRRITSQDKAERMPSDGDPLPADQIALIKRWIEEGAKYDSDDPAATLSSIVPPPVHPAPPEIYPATQPITAVAFRVDGDKTELLVGGYHEITSWNPADGTLLRRIKNEGQRTYALQLCPDGKYLAAASGSPGKLGELRLFAAASGELVRVLGSAPDAALDAAFSPDGKRIAMAAADSAVTLFDVETGAKQIVLASHSDWVHAVAWSPDGTQLASGSRDKTAKVVNVEKGEVVAVYNGHNQTVLGVAFHPDGQQVYSSGANNQIHLWKTSDGQKSADVANFGGEAYKLVATEKHLIATSADKSARLFDRTQRNQIREFKDHAEAVLCAALSPDGKLLATGAFDGSVRVWNAETGETVKTFIAAPGFVAPAGP
jgi:WD40 repeat protein